MSQSATTTATATTSSTQNNPTTTVSPVISAWAAAVAAPPPTNLTKQTNLPNLCKHCKIKTRYHDGKKLHDYCSVACATQALGRAPRPPPPPQKSSFLSKLTGPFSSKKSSSSSASSSLPTISTLNSTPAASSSSLSSNKRCKYPTCPKNVYVSRNGVASDYCSINHRDAAQSFGSITAASAWAAIPIEEDFEEAPPSRISRMFPAAGESTCIWCKGAIDEKELFCGQNCISQAEQRAPALIEIPAGHKKYNAVNDQFNKSWRHPTKRPQVKRVYKIIYSPNMMKLYTTYRGKVHAKLGSASGGGGPGNEQRRWHGTKRSCTIGDNGKTNMCTAENCSLCHIIRGSFDIKHYKKNTSYGRFGCGIYTSSTSSKSNDYSVNLVTSPTKALLLNNVVVGRGEKLTQDSPNLTAPPTAGFDSVLGEAGAGSVLNYDECVIYNNDAIRPSYLVIYS